MKHFYENIQGWSEFIIPFYEHMVATSDNGATFVEVGAWKGRSIAYLATEIINSDKAIFVHAVDTWLGSKEHLKQGFRDDIINDKIYYEYLNNIEPVKDWVNSIRLPSVEAAKIFYDNSLDLVLLDGDHTTNGVMNDIEAWWPKIKPGGILAGDDYDSTYWPSVCKAVHDKFGYNDIHLFGTGGIWFKIKRREVTTFIPDDGSE